MSERNFTLLKFGAVGLAGYLLGSLLPFGYLTYLFRSTILPDPPVFEEEFDRSLLEGADEVTVSELVDVLKQNPELFRNQFLDRPVDVVGVVEYFIDGSSFDDDFTVTLSTGERWTSIFLSFDAPQDPSVLEIRKDAPLRAVCMVTSTTTDSIHMDHCEVR